MVLLERLRIRMFWNRSFRKVFDNFGGIFYIFVYENVIISGWLFAY